MINILEKTKNYDRIINMPLDDNISKEIVHCYQEILFNSDDIEKINKIDELVLGYFEDDKLNSYIKDNFYESNCMDIHECLIKLYEEYIEMSFSTISSTKWL